MTARPVGEDLDDGEMTMTEAQAVDWGYSINRLMDEARRSVADGSDLGELIKAKLVAADEGHKIGGVKGISIVQDSRNEARALFAAAIEKGLPDTSEEALQHIILETALAAEDLRMKDAVANAFRHQLQLETMCQTLTSAVLYLLCKQLQRPADAPEDA
jgi:hypothetical protein